MSEARATALETIWLEVPEIAVELFEAALSTACTSIGFFLDESTGRWRIEGVRQPGHNDAALGAGIAVAQAITGFVPALNRVPIPAQGWLARTRNSFPEQLVGRRIAVRGTHIAKARAAGRVTVTLDAEIAFGSGEHGSTRGCLRALEKRIAARRPRRILDLGSGSGILAIAAAKLLRRKVLAVDIDPRAVHVARRNAARNGVRGLMRVAVSDGWRSRTVRRGAPYDLVFANILARPLCTMAKQARIAPGGRLVLSGLLQTQARMVLAAYRPQGLYLEATIREGNWATLIVRRASPLQPMRKDG
ncbi:MAG: 50S ribosomal protein L11 methyltransferase [Acetobacteraceae bacterium]|nr:50S ribosomal protein L11 methyltransferase [Acetobacteraceae bacterium]